MIAGRFLVRLALVASLLLPTAHAKKGEGEKTNIKPSIIGGAPLKLSIYNFNATPATGYWVTPEGILQSLPGAATIPPTGTTPIVINSFRFATIFLQLPQGGGVWKHLSADNPTAFIIAGTPPAGFKAGLRGQDTDEPRGEVEDDDGPDGKKKVVINKNVTNSATIVTPPAPPVPAADGSDKDDRKGPRVAKGPQVAEFLRIHRAARKDVGVSPLEWSVDLAQAAQEWAEQIAKTGKVEQQPGSTYGQNLAIGSDDYSPATAALAWLAEKATYDPEATPPKGTGKKAAKREEAAKAARYTQMVWGESKTVGYGIAKTTDGKTVVVAFYDPRGNIDGERPYAK